MLRKSCDLSWVSSEDWKLFPSLPFAFFHFFLLLFLFILMEEKHSRTLAIKKQLKSFHDTFCTLILIDLLNKACALSPETGSKDNLYFYESNLYLLFLSLESYFCKPVPGGEGWRTTLNDRQQRTLPKPPISTKIGDI